MMAPTPRVLFATTVIHTSDTFLEELAAHLRRSEWGVDLLTNPAGSDDRQRPFDNVIPIQWHRGARRPFDSIGQFARIRRILVSGKYDLVHTHTPTASAMVRMAAASLRDAPLILYTAHGFHFGPGMSGPSHLVAQGVESRLLNHTDMLITINEDDYRWALARESKARVVKSKGVGIADSFFDHTADRAAVRAHWGVRDWESLVLVVGELGDRKRPDLAIRAMSACSGPRVLMFVGSGDGLRQLQEQAHRAAASDDSLRVVFAGRQTDIPSLLQAADCLLHTARQEGLPTVVLEAMASRLPVASFDIRGCRDLLRNGRGWLASNGDVVTLASNLDRILSGDPEVAAATERAWNFSLDYRRSLQIVDMASTYRRALGLESGRDVERNG